MKTILRLFKILELFETNKELRLQDISDMLDINKSTIYRFLKMLEKNGFVYRDPESKKFRLGLYLMKLGFLVQENLDIVYIAKKHLQELWDLTGETVHVATFIRDQATYIYKIDSKYPVRMQSKIGATIALYNTGIGKVILAFQDENTIKTILKDLKMVQMTKNTITDKDRLLKELEEIRKNGYALDRCEHENNLNCIAAPIKDHNEKVLYAFSLSALDNRMDIEDLLKYKDMIREKSRVRSEEMGYTG